MAIFGRGPQPQSQYDDEWVSDYLDEIFSSSGVRQSDQDRMQLTLFLYNTLDDQADGWFSQTGDQRARDQYAQLLADSASIGERTTYLLRWNDAVANLMSQKWTSLQSVLVEAGQRHGRFRFFPSQCCGEPVEFDLQTGQGHCSKCGAAE